MWLDTAALAEKLEPSGTRLINALQTTVRETRDATSVRKALGMGTAESLCELCAMPFAHGNALAPEIHRLHAALDSCQDQTILQQTHKSNSLLEGRLLNECAAPLQLLPPVADVDARQSAVQCVAETLRREAEYNEQRRVAIESTRERAARGDFMQRVYGNKPANAP